MRSRATGAGPNRREEAEQGGGAVGRASSFPGLPAASARLSGSMDLDGTPFPLSTAEQLDQEVDWPQFYAVVHWIQAVTAALSVIGSSSVIGYAVFQNSARTPEGRPVFYLSLSSLLLGVCWLMGALLYHKGTTESTSQEVPCYNLQIIAELLLMEDWPLEVTETALVLLFIDLVLRNGWRSTTRQSRWAYHGAILYVAFFLYTVNYTWLLYMDLKQKYNQDLLSQSPQVLNRSGPITVILASAIPLFLMIPVFGVGNHYECYQNITRKHGCLLMRTDLSSPKQPPCTSLSFYSITVFLVSFAATFLFILVLLIRARTLYKKFIISAGFMGDRQWAMIKMVEKGVVLYPVVFLCCWGPAFILGIIELVQVQSDKVYMVFCVLEALTASSQGLLNCVVYGWTQHMSRCLKREACRDVDTQTPLLRSQKRTYASTLQTHPPAGPRSATAAL